LASSIWYSVTLNDGFFVAAIIAQPRAIHSDAFNVLETWSIPNVDYMIYWTDGIRVVPPTTSIECNLIFWFYTYTIKNSNNYYNLESVGSIILTYYSLFILWLKSTSSTKYSTLIFASLFELSTLRYFSIASNNLRELFLFSIGLRPPDYYSKISQYLINVVQSKSRAPKFLSLTYAIIVAFSLVNDATNADVLEWPISTNATYLGTV